MLKNSSLVFEKQNNQRFNFIQGYKNQNSSSLWSNCIIQWGQLILANEYWWFLTSLIEPLFKLCYVYHCFISLQIIVFSSSGEICHQGSYGNIAEKDEKLLSQWSDARLQSITHQAGQNTSEIERAELHQQVAKRHQYQQDEDQEKIRGMDLFLSAIWSVVWNIDPWFNSR